MKQFQLQNILLHSKASGYASVIRFKTQKLLKSFWAPFWQIEKAFSTLECIIYCILNNFSLLEIAFLFARRCVHCVTFAWIPFERIFHSSCCHWQWKSCECGERDCKNCCRYCVWNSIKNIHKWYSTWLLMCTWALSYKNSNRWKKNQSTICKQNVTKFKILFIFHHKKYFETFFDLLFNSVVH